MIALLTAVSTFSDLLARGLNESPPYAFENHLVGAIRPRKVSGSGGLVVNADGTLQAAKGISYCLYAYDYGVPSGTGDVSLGVWMRSASDCGGPACAISADGRDGVVSGYDLATGRAFLAEIHSGYLSKTVLSSTAWTPQPGDRLTETIDPVAGTITLRVNADAAHATVLATTLAKTGGRIGIWNSRRSDTFNLPVVYRDFEAIFPSGAVPQTTPTGGNVDPADVPGGPQSGIERTRVYVAYFHAANLQAQRDLASSADLRSMALSDERWTVETNVPQGGSAVNPTTLAAQYAANANSATIPDDQVGYVNEAQGGVPNVGDLAQPGILLYVRDRAWLPTPTSTVASALQASVYSAGRPLSFAEASTIRYPANAFVDVSGIALQPLPVDFFAAATQGLPRIVSFNPPPLGTVPFAAAQTP